jgi:hypothetical protein
VKQYCNARHDGPFVPASPAPSAEEIANELEILRLLKEERALALQLRDMAVRMDALAGQPKSGPDSTLAYDIELVSQCLNDATNRSVSEARKSFKDRVRPYVDPKTATKRFTRALKVIISPDGDRIVAALTTVRAKDTP